MRRIRFYPLISSHTKETLKTQGKYWSYRKHFQFFPIVGLSGSSNLHDPAATTTFDRVPFNLGSIASNQRALRSSSNKVGETEMSEVKDKPPVSRNHRALRSSSNIALRAERWCNMTKLVSKSASLTLILQLWSKGRASSMPN